MIQITNEDNMKLMSRYEDNYFDLAIVDPPYGIGVSEMNIGARNIKNKSCDNKGWDNNTPSQTYFNELYRVSKHQIVWGANYFNCFNGKHGAIIWHKNNPLPTSSDCEIASYSKHAKTAIYNKTWTNFVNDKTTEHSTEKPIQLYKWLLNNYAKEGDKILDTHLGSGSIAIACHEYKFDLTACEIDTEYYNAAMKRLKIAQMQIKLF